MARNFEAERLKTRKMETMGAEPVSGNQYVLKRGGYEAVVASVGASLRVLTYGGRNLVVPFGADEIRPAYRGATLAPWPNRVVDARYVFEGVEYQLPVNEPARGHALHGLVDELDFEIVHQTPTELTLATVIEPQDGYPWRVRLTTTYNLSDDGLNQSVETENLSNGIAPIGLSAHPYLVAGEGCVDDWTLELAADQVLLVSPDRLAPTKLVEVPAELDFRTARQIDATKIDHAYTGLRRDDAGRATVKITAEEGTGVAMDWAADCPWVQLHTADLSVGDPGHRAGLAVEPMTCSPDAFNASNYAFETGLLTLEPGATAEASWRIFATENQ